MIQPTTFQLDHESRLVPYVSAEQQKQKQSETRLEIARLREIAKKAQAELDAAVKAAIRDGIATGGPTTHDLGQAALTVTWVDPQIAIDAAKATRS